MNNRKSAGPNPRIVYEKFTLSDDIEYEEDGPLDIRVVLTPFGMVPVANVEEAKANMKIWVANTNFDINKEILEIINKVEGIEALKPLTRYKLAIGIGKLFDDTIVKNDISKQVNSLLKKYEHQKGCQF